MFKPIVDLTVYHGGERFDNFELPASLPGIWTTGSLDVAETYADRFPPHEAEIKVLRIVMHNPLDLRDPLVWAAFFGKPFHFSADSSPYSRQRDMALSIPKESAAMLNRARALGYDGIIHFDTCQYNRGAEPSYVALDPSQISYAHNHVGPQWWDHLVRGIEQVAPQDQLAAA